MTSPTPTTPPRMPDTEDESWRKMRTITVLTDHGCAYDIAYELARYGFRTLDDLSSWWQDKQTSDIPGLSQADAAAIDAAVDRFWREWESREEHKA